ALGRAHVACLVVDAVQGFHRQEARLAGDALEAGCSVLLLYNKWDLMTDRDQEWKRLQSERERRYPTLADLPAVPVSAIVGTHISRLSQLVRQRRDEHRRKIRTPELNRWLERAQRRRAAPATK